MIDQYRPPSAVQFGVFYARVRILVHLNASDLFGSGVMVLSLQVHFDYTVAAGGAWNAESATIRHVCKSPKILALESRSHCHQSGYSCRLTCYHCHAATKPSAGLINYRLGSEPHSDSVFYSYLLCHEKFLLRIY